MKNENEALSFGVTDAQSDSLSYNLTPVLYIGGIPQGPWTYDRPLSFFGYPNANLQFPAGFHINPNTGLVQFRPTALNQVAIVAVKVTSWKRINGSMQERSKVYRYQGVVIGAMDTTNATPYVSVLTSNPQGCIGDTLRARYRLHDADSNQYLRAYPLNTPEGMTWSVDYAQSPPVLTIQWVPDSADLKINSNSTFYELEFAVEDDHCPLPKHKSWWVIFSISLRPAADVHLYDSGCGYIGISVQNIQNTVSLAWEMDPVIGSPSLISMTNPPRLLPGIHYSVLRLGGYRCNTTFYDSFTIKPYAIPDLSVNPVFFCPGTLRQFHSGLDSSFVHVDHTWNWKGTTTQNTQGSVTIPVDSGILYLQVVDSMGCEVNDSLKIHLFQDWILSTGLDTMLCSDDPYLLYVAMDSLKTFIWWDNTTLNMTNAYQSGTYWLEAMDTNGCSRRDSFDIVLNPIPQPNLGPDASICHYDSVLLDAGTGYVSYSWSDGDNTQMRWVSGNAVLQVFVEDQNGCVGSDTIEVGRYSPSQLNLGNDTLLCWTDSLLLNAGTFTSWLWNDGNTQGQRWVDQEGTYRVTATDSNSCYATDSLVVSINKPEVQIIGDTLFCSGDSVELSLLQNYSLIVWSTGDTASTTYVSAAGMSYVMITDSLGCSNGDGYYVFEAPLPDASFTYTDLGGRFIQFNTSNTLLEYTWIFGDGDSSELDDPLHHYDSVKNYQVELFVVDDYGCENSTTQTISFGTGLGKAMETPLNVYPNPSNGSFFIDWQGALTKVHIIDQMGKKVATFTTEEGTRQYNLSLAPGVYMLMDASRSFEPVRIQVLH